MSVCVGHVLPSHLSLQEVGSEDCGGQRALRVFAQDLQNLEEPGLVESVSHLPLSIWQVSLSSHPYDEGHNHEQLKHPRKPGQYQDLMILASTGKLGCKALTHSAVERECERSLNLEP